MNATDLFLSDSNNFRNCENFWSSLFAVQVLDASHSGIELEIPVFVYTEDEDETRWLFEPDEPLIVPGYLAFSSVTVEGKLRTGCIPGIAAELPHEFHELRPDVIFLWANTVSVVETKTVGANISEKECLYVKLCQWFTENDRTADAYLLLSAGHQPDWQVRMLAKEEWRGPKKLILWEKFFETIETYVPNSLMSRLIPNLNQYYQPDGGYLQGNFS
ncbi:hypothetical protein JZU46_04745 [bacterium]|nr:hypothetical protein [bacterium]